MLPYCETTRSVATVCLSPFALSLSKGPLPALLGLVGEGLAAQAAAGNEQELLGGAGEPWTEGLQGLERGR